MSRLAIADTFSRAHQCSIASHSQRYKELVGSDPEAESMEEKITLALGWVETLVCIRIHLTIYRKRERETTEAETSAAAASRSHSQIQTSLNIAKQNLKSKRDEMSRMFLCHHDGMHPF